MSCLTKDPYTKRWKSKLWKPFLRHVQKVNCLKLLVENNLSSIAFPAISTGLFGFPKKLAAKIAISKIDDFISVSEKKYKDIIKVVINVYDDGNLKIYEDVIRNEYYK